MLRNCVPFDCFRNCYCTVTQKLSSVFSSGLKIFEPYIHVIRILVVRITSYLKKRKTYKHRAKIVLRRTCSRKGNIEFGTLIPSVRITKHVYAKISNLLPQFSLGTLRDEQCLFASQGTHRRRRIQQSTLPKNGRISTTRIRKWTNRSYCIG